MSSAGVGSSGSTEILVAAPPSTEGVAQSILATMAALSGVMTDYNQGSQIRTMSESQGAVTETQGIWSQAQALQSLVYGTLSLFSVPSSQPQYAIGDLVFATSTGGSPPPASQTVSIPAGTIVQTQGGIQIVTSAAATLVQGNSSVTVSGQAVLAGSSGNVTPGSVNQIISGLTYPLFVNNPAAFTGGTNAQSLGQTLANFAAYIGSIGLASPQAIADAAVGVVYSSEVCQYSTVYEPWIAAGTGAGSGTAGYNVYIDNGTGTASSGLVASVYTYLLGSTTSGGTSNSGTQNGFHDSGVPFSVIAATGTPAVVMVSGTLVNTNNLNLVSGAILSAVSGYFTLPFGTSAEQGVLAAAVNNAVAGQLSSFALSLAASGGSVVSTLTVPGTGRVVFGSCNIFLQ